MLEITFLYNPSLLPIFVLASSFLHPYLELGMTHLACVRLEVCYMRISSGTCMLPRIKCCLHQSKLTN